MTKKKVVAYYDGSNFYHLADENFGITSIEFVEFTKSLLNEDEELVKIKYFNAPVNQQEEPEMYKDQQKFLARVEAHPDIQLFLGTLVMHQCSPKYSANNHDSLTCKPSSQTKHIRAGQYSNSSMI